MGDIEVKIKSINEKIKKEEQMRQAAERVMSQTGNPLVKTQCEQNINDAKRHIDYLQKELEKLQIRQRNSLQYPISSGQQTPQQTSPAEGYPPPQYQHSLSYPPPPGSQGDSPMSRAVPMNQEDDPSIQVTRKGANMSNLGGISRRFSVSDDLEFNYLIKSDSPITSQKISLKLHELEFKLHVERKLKEGSEKMTDAVLLQDPKNKRSIAEVQIKTWESKENFLVVDTNLVERSHNWNM
ncbi:4817_t:CDS:2, partial [Acaulospora morrowiae]